MSLPAANFHDLYKRYSGDVYRFAIYLTGDGSVADDLTAEAFLRIWASPAPTHLQTVKSYLFAIVRNLYVQNWRTGRRNTPLSDTHAINDPVEQGIDDKAELRCVVAALAELDQQERAYEEIARILEIKPVAARVHRARRKLMQARSIQS
ncbi:MAG: RNA polymerase sigma factor [Acidobacteria bacterium]|nr:RNA polymerase sigma factor [Acidobacteriota bacterium]